MKKKLLAIIFSIAMCLPLALGLVACGGNEGGDTNGGETPADKPVASIEVTTEPDKTEYYVDEEFSLEGGEITVTYEDDTTEELALTAEGVECTQPDMSKPGNKTITVTYGGKRDRFTISVINQGFKFTFNYNYQGSTNTEINVSKGQTADEPAAPSREGYTFYAWYADEACTMQYDFDAPVTADTTIYAAWKENGETYYEATYNLNYYGVVPATFTQIVKAGDSVKDLAFTPERSEYKFDGWFTDEACTAAFTDKAISADTTIYAGWTKTKTGESTYTFEAEDTDLSGKSGPGFSGSAQEEGMIVANDTASGGACVSYLYQSGITLEFNIASDEAVADATVTVSLAAELDDVSFNSDEFQVIVNGTPLNYASVSLENNKTFKDAIVIENVALKEGENEIQLKVNNTRIPPEGGTYKATAPMVDCVKITTTAVLIWDANYGLPMDY